MDNNSNNTNYRPFKPTSYSGGNSNSDNSFGGQTNNNQSGWNQSQNQQKNQNPNYNPGVNQGVPRPPFHNAQNYSVPQTFNPNNQSGNVNRPRPPVQIVQPGMPPRPLNPNIVKNNQVFINQNSQGNNSNPAQGKGSFYELLKNFSSFNKYPRRQHVSGLTTLASFPVDVYVHGQDPSEQVLLFMREHIVVLIFNFVIYSVFALPFPFYLRFFVNFINDIAFNNALNLDFLFQTSVWIGFILIWLMYSFKNYLNIFLRWFYNVNVLTNNKFVDLDMISLFNVRTEETTVDNIEEVKELQPSIFQSIFHMGNIEIYTAAEKTQFTLSNVPQSNNIRDFVTDVVSAKKQSLRSID